MKKTVKKEEGKTSAVTLVHSVYSFEDLRKAFEDGRQYANDELVLDTKGRDTAFECWFEQIFRNQK
jgi:hypothetical protein